MNYLLTSNVNYFALTLLLCMASVVTLQAQTLTTIFSFSTANNGGYLPFAALVQGLDGNFYGTTFYGGNYDLGTLFRMTPQGTLTTLVNFDGAQTGSLPRCTLELGADGNLYGVTANGGAYNDGTVFQYSLASGKLSTLHTFSGVDGNFPLEGLVRGDDGRFYGTASAGGSFSYGVVFTIAPGGKFEVLHNFSDGDDDGGNPNGRLVQATDGNLYGTTVGGGSGKGTIYKISTYGTFTLLYRFCEGDPGCPQGEWPEAGLLQGSNGSLYGGEPGYADTYGSLFALSGEGGFSIVHAFDFTDGSSPESPPYQATDGNFYGTTYYGGYYYQCDSAGCGVLYSLAPDGNYTAIYDFCSVNGLFSCMDGSTPFGSVIQGTDGNLYGTTTHGGENNGYGTIYRVSLDLPPFIKIMPTLGTIGDPVKILGNNLTGTTSVSFNGIPATFTVVSSTLIKTTVPSGATNGSVEVTTPTSTLISNLLFRVIP